MTVAGNYQVSPYFLEEHDQMRKIIRDFVKKEITPNIEEWETIGEVPRELLKKMGNLGFLSLHYPEGIGGQGGDYFMSIILAEELNKCGSGGVPLAIMAQTEMAISHIHQFGSKEQKLRFLKPALTGEKVAAIGIKEFNREITPLSIQTTARRVGNEWIINGTKTLIINGSQADFITIAARTSDEPGEKGIRLFIVETEQLGASVCKKLDMVGMRSSNMNELVLENVHVPHENLLGIEGKGYEQIKWHLQRERMIEAAAAIGYAELAYELSLDYAQNRQAFNQPISNFQVIAHKLAEMKTEIEICRELVYATAHYIDNGKVYDEKVAMSKLAATQMGFYVVDHALQIFGGNGYMQEYPIEKLWRDSRLARINGGSDELMKDIIAENLGL